MNIIKSVLDKNYHIYGFILEDNEFYDLNNLIEKRFKNKQIKLNETKITELNNFKIKDLPMIMKINNNFVPINNNIELLKKIESNSQITGFIIKINNQETLLNLNDFYNLSEWCNPINFSVRKRNDIFYICGKAGTKLKNIPIEIQSDIVSKYKLKTSLNIKSKKILTDDYSFDLINLFEYLNFLKAFIIKIPENNYIATKETIEIGDKFIDLNLGEIASPKINYSDNKININMIFRKMGNVNIDGVLYPVFDISSKHLFLNGKNYINNIGIIIDKKYIKELKEYIGKNIPIRKYTNETNSKRIRSFLNNQNYEIWMIETQFLNIINNKKVLNIPELYQLNKDLINNKVIMRYLNHVKKQLNYNDKKDRFGIYQYLNDEAINILENEGIDIYSGIYKKQGIEIKPETKILSASIQYTIKGYKTLPSVKDILSKKSKKFISEKLEDIMSDLEQEKNLDIKISKYEMYSNKYIKIQNYLIKKLWIHNICLLINEDYFVDSKFWTKINNNEFICSEIGFEDFHLKLENIKER